MAEDYEYRGLMAQAWDLLRGDYSTWTDTAFYRAIIERQAGPALDVGCGTGRHTLEYRASGLDVDGVDISPEMLAICRAKAATRGIDIEGRLFEQAMDRLALPRRYATIFVPSFSFQLLTDLDAAARAMACFHDQLAARGVLVVSFTTKLWDGERAPPQMEWSDWNVIAEAKRGEDGATIRRWLRERFDHIRQVQDEENRYEVLVDGVVVETQSHARSPSVRWYSQAQAIAAFERAGLTDLRVTSKDTFEPATAEETRFKITGARA